MTTDITASGYANLNIGNLIAANWAFIELQDSTGQKIIRFPKTDVRVTQTILDTKKVVYRVLLHGSDTDIAAKGLPQTFAKAAFKLTDADGVAVLAVDTFDLATLNAAIDELDLTISVGILV